VIQENNYRNITENQDQHFLRVQVFFHEVPCNIVALGVRSHNCTITIATCYIHSHANIKLQPHYGNCQSSFLCCILGRVKFVRYLLRIPNQHAPNKCLTGGRAGTVRGPQSFQVTYVVCINSHPYTKLFLLFFFLFFVFLLQSAR